MTNAEKIKQLQNDLETTLKAINDEYEAGNTTRFDNLHEVFTVTINNCKVSLGSMDAYDLLQHCLTEAASVSKELELNI